MSCATCGASASALCGRCKGPRYCSLSCQHKDWGVHKLTCTPCEPQSKSPRSDEVCPRCKLVWDMCTCTEDEKPKCWICHESTGILLLGCACRNGGGCARVNLDDLVPLGATWCRLVPIVVVPGMCIAHVSSRTTLIAIVDMPIAKYASSRTSALFIIL